MTLLIWKYSYTGVGVNTTSSSKLSQSLPYLNRFATSDINLQLTIITSKFLFLVQIHSFFTPKSWQSLAVGAISVPLKWKVAKGREAIQRYRYRNWWQNKCRGENPRAMSLRITVNRILTSTEMAHSRDGSFAQFVWFFPCDVQDSTITLLASGKLRQKW